MLFRPPFRAIHLVPVLAVVVFGLGTSAGRGQDAVSPDLKSKQNESILRLKRAQTLRQQGKLAEALTAAREALAKDREILGKDDARCGVALAFIADVQEQQGAYAEARPAREEVITVYTAAWGEKHAACGRGAIGATPLPDDGRAERRAKASL